MSMFLNQGENDVIDSGGIDEVVSYTPVEAGADAPEEKSDAQMIADGEIDVGNDVIEIFVDPNSVHKPGEEKEVSEETSEEEVVASEEETEEVDEEVQETTPAEEEVEAKPEKISATQKRINKITREKYEAQRETERIKERLLKLEAKYKAVELEKQKAALTNARPKQEDFDSDEEFYESMGRWAAKMEIHDDRSSKVDEVLVEEEPVDPRTKIIETGKETYPDFEELVLREDLKITPLMIEAASDSEYASDIFYHLGQNPEYAATISAMKSPAQVAREIGRIENKFIGEEIEEVVTSDPSMDSEFLEKSKSKPKKKKVSPAPAPVKPLGGGGVTATNLENAGIDDYFAARGYDRSGMKIRKT